MNAREREREREARRAAALRKLARVFGSNGGDRGRAAYGAERNVLTQILRCSDEPEVVRLARDRLAVIAASDSDSDLDDDAPSPPAPLSPAPPPAVTKTRFSAAWTASALRAIANGTRPVPDALASGAFWEDLVAHENPSLAHLTSGATITHRPPDEEGREMWFGLRGRGATGARLRESIRERGYFVLRRPEYYGPAPASSSSRAAADPSDAPADPWTAALSAPPSTDLRTTSLDDLADAVDALVASGWPAVSVLAFDAAWAVIDRLFDVAEAALPITTRRGNNARTASKKPERSSSAERGAAHGEDDEDDDDDPLVLEPSAFAWALGWRDATTPRAAVSAAGANFGLPHRDYPASEAWDFDANAPRLICAWVPLTDATPETGCVSVVPRDADDLWGEPGHPHHLAPAESVGTGGGGGGGSGAAAPGRGEGNYGKGDGGEIGEGVIGGGAGEEGEGREGDGVRRVRRARLTRAAASTIRFPIARARAIPAEAGSVCLWAGNTVHWGGACSLARPADEDEDEASERAPDSRSRVRERPNPSAEAFDNPFEGSDPVADGFVRVRDARGFASSDPRAPPRRARPRRSLACTFRRRSSSVAFKSAGKCHAPFLTRAECRALDVAGRARMICQSLALYSRWFETPAFLPGLLSEPGQGFEVAKEGGETFGAKTTFRS